MLKSGYEAIYGVEFNGHVVDIGIIDATDNVVAGIVVEDGKLPDAPKAGDIFIPKRITSYEGLIEELSALNNTGALHDTKFTIEQN